MRKRHVKKWANKFPSIDYVTFIQGFVYCGWSCVRGLKQPTARQQSKFEEQSPRLQREKERVIAQLDKELQDEQNNT